MPEEQPLPVVESHAPWSDAATQVKAIRTFKGEYSHDDWLPLRIRIKRTGWFSRKISVTTTEPVWYRDPITKIDVPAGFTYDLASIPRPMWLVIAPWDIAMESLFHDLLYRQQMVRRRVADMTLLSMMADREVPWHVRWAVYIAVRLCGWIAWRQRAAQMDVANLEAAKEAAEHGEPVEFPSAIEPDKREPEKTQ